MDIFEEETLDRLTRIGRRITAALTSDEEYQSGDCIVVLVGDGTIGKSSHHGFTDSGDAIAFLLSYVQRLCEHNGATLVVLQEAGGSVNLWTENKSSAFCGKRGRS